MSIDLKTYTGEEPAVAAGQPLELNSYQAETQSESYGVADIAGKETPAVTEPVQQTEASPFQDSPQDRNFRALADQVEKLKAEREQDRRDHQLQLDMLKANSAPRHQEQPKPKNMFDGMADTDIPNVAEIRREWESRESNYQARIQELQVAQFHPDYAEVVEKFGAPLLKEKPILLNSVLGAENKALALYEIGKLAQQAKMAGIPPAPPAAPAAVAAPEAPQAPSPAARKIVENARKPGSIASVGGQSALSQADFYASMSDKDFMEMANKHLAEI